MTKESTVPDGQRDVTLPSGKVVRIKRPGQRAYMVSQSGVLPDAEKLRLRDMAKDKLADNPELTTKELMEQLDTSGIQWDDYKVAEANVAFVCACTVKPRLTLEEPPPAGYVFFDNYTKEDWDALVEAVLKMKAQADREAADRLGPLSETEPAS